MLTLQQLQDKPIDIDDETIVSIWRGDYHVGRVRLGAAKKDYLWHLENAGKKLGPLQHEVQQILLFADSYFP